MREVDQKLIQNVLPHLGQFKTKGNEILPKYCPICNGGQHNDKMTFALNSETGASNCLRGSCGWSGNIYQLSEYLGLEVKKNNMNYFREYKPKKIYKKPKVKDNGLTKKVISYFKTRGISKETLINNKISTDKKGNIMFNYYDENEELTFIKYKIPRKPIGNDIKSWRESNTRPILYGMNDCDTDYPLIIVEGEPDKLVLDECGVKNATSIPSGTKDISWISECWEFLEKFDHIILWGDNDKAGREFIQSTIVRLDEWKLSIVKTEYKDANVALYKKGKKEVLNILNSAVAIDKQYIAMMSDVKRKNYKDNIVIPTGFKSLDEKIGGAYLGQLFIWSGYTGGGKSTFLNQLVLNGLEYAKAFIYSGELPKEDVKEICDMQLSGEKYLSSYYSEFKKQYLPIPDEKYFDYLDWVYKDSLYLFDSEDYATDKEILKAMKYMVKRENVEVFLIDNLMTVPSDSRVDETERITKFINKLKAFARKFQAVVHLVAHPRKPSFNQTRMGKYDVSGTANIINLADRGLGIHRITKKEKKENPDYENKGTAITFFKDRKHGINDGEITLGYEYFSKRFYSDKEEKIKKYSWVKKMKTDKKMKIRDELIVNKNTEIDDPF